MSTPAMLDCDAAVAPAGTARIVRRAADDERAAARDVDVEPAVVPFEDADVGELGELAHERGLLVLQVQPGPLSAVAPSDVIERRDAIGQRH